MSLVVKLIITAVAGYLLGSANTSLIVGKFYGVDVRKHGSGNAGMTNTLRTLGKLAALFVIIGDLLKGILACLVGLYIVGDRGIEAEVFGRTWNEELGLMVGGISAIIGHNWPAYFRFKGGKGILTSLAVVLMMDPLIALILFGIFAVIVAITRYVSLGSIIGSGLFPVAAAVFGRSNAFIIFAAILGLLAIIRHRANIQRIYNGTESKLGSKKKNN
ncbi:MAG: glycerol-3-phosphate 1-O-acyltransferase PlsY [Clostridia bacterium]|nr:glycerol-3-phosphate 1-O-acyltransferase PlsY [Clostridia bacterium]